jgi:polynucleotide 5'-kinase involved in rRNA processing
VSFREHQKLDTLGEPSPPSDLLAKYRRSFNITVRMQTLRKLHPVAMDSSGRTECLPNTRLDILNRITDWITNPHDGHNVLWIHGLAGSGKSTIATSVANLFRDLNRLGAFVFFNRDVEKGAIQQP